MFVFSSKKILLYLLVLAGDLFMEWSHAILSMCDTKVLIDPIICRYLAFYISYQHHSYFISQNFEKEVSEETSISETYQLIGDIN